MENKVGYKYTKEWLNTIEGKLGIALIIVVILSLGINLFFNSMATTNIFFMLEKGNGINELQNIKEIIKAIIYHNALRAFFIVLICTGLMYFRLNSFITKPIRKLNNQIKMLKGGKNPQDLQVEGPLELMELVASLNQMLKSTSREIILDQQHELKYDSDIIKMDFLGNVSHELRTPLNVILGTLQLLELQNESNRDKRMTKHIKTMKQNCYRLLRLSNNIIDMASIDSGLHEINMGNHDIVSIIREITLAVADYVKNRGLEVSFFTELKKKIIVCDREKIERILFNLLSNAIKCSKPEGKIMVMLQEKNDYILFSVKDNGRGIPQEKQDIIFNKFRQGEDLLTRSHEGSGLGLPLTKALVEMHDGKIHFKSEYGKGSEFIVKLPIKPLIGNGEVLNQSELVSSKTSQLEKIHIELSDINCI